MGILVLIVFGVILIVWLIIFIVQKALKNENPIEQINNLLQNKQYRKALSLSQNLLSTNPDNFVVKFYMGQAYEGLHDLKNAITYYEKAAVTVNSSNDNLLKAQIFLKIATIYKKEHRYEEALGYFMMALDKQPRNTKALLEAADILFELKRYRKARHLLEQFIQLKPNNIRARYTLAKICYELNDYTCSVYQLQQIREHIPNNDPLYYKTTILMADNYFQLKRFDDSIKLLTPMLSHDDYFETAAISLIRSLVYGNYLQKATEVAQTYLTNMSREKKVEALYLIASGYYKKGDINKALDKWKEAAKIYPNYRDLKEIIQQYRVFYENPKLKNLFTRNDTEFEEYVTKLLKLKPPINIIKHKDFTIFKSNNVNHVFFRRPYPITFQHLNDVEQTVRDDIVANISLNIYSLYGMSDDAKEHKIFRKVFEIAGNDLINLINES